MDKVLEKLLEILDGKHPTYQTAKLKKLMLRYGLIENKCEKCSIGDTWCGESITLQLDHRNGRSDDHSRENVRMLCPNCHSQTSTWGRRNSKNPLMLPLKEKFLARKH
jgi:5-methylcytosine-specific restriction endonuclease McrA